MTFEQALNLKNQQSPFINNNISYIWIVVPFKYEDNAKYKTDYLLSSNKFLDDDAKKYSTDDDFGFEYMVKK
ncbi:hypothetical protein KU06062659_1100004 [Flavobacterium psychrophilum]|uniref:hypothetical protein n=1 Tax=Flavobacterium psychrophilum TaxID=96345 RepID=UPI000B7C1C62|nr:hypothetical protein [Flavobacterium psychrophilum]SNB04682.1 hypothetical protein KU06062659_1100004 [Flavobacterium psychrophilum]